MAITFSVPRKPAIAVLVAFAILATIVLLRPTNDSSVLNDVGPAEGDGTPIYLFQSYSCAACWNATFDGTLDATLNASAASGARIVWKNVAPAEPHAALASHCVWQEFPDRWLAWNHAAFVKQLQPGAGWPSLDRITFVTESELTLSITETQAFEACLFEDGWSSQVRADTHWWSNQTPLPALYADGAWYPLSPEAIQEITG